MNESKTFIGEFWPYILLVAIALFGTYAWGCAKAGAYERATGKQISPIDAILLDPKLRGQD